MFFVIGFLIGALNFGTFSHIFLGSENKNVVGKFKFSEASLDNSLYNETLSDELYKKVRVLCLVMTHPANHRKKALHVKGTWGKRCNKLLFMSSENDLVLEPVVFEVKESRDHLWEKTKKSFIYVYENHIDDADWFLKADDDSQVNVC